MATAESCGEVMSITPETIARLRQEVRWLFSAGSTTETSHEARLEDAREKLARADAMLECQNSPIALSEHFAELREACRVAKNRMEKFELAWAKRKGASQEELDSISDRYNH